MIHDWKMELYWRLPVFLQELAVNMRASTLEKLYYGPGYADWRQQFHSWRSWSRAEAQSWQNQRLQYLVELAGTRVPYYREQWRQVDWKSVRSATDLHLLPRLEKQAIRQNERAFMV